MNVNFEYYRFLLCGQVSQFYKGGQSLRNSQLNITRAMNCLEQQATMCGRCLFGQTEVFS